MCTRPLHFFRSNVKDENGKYPGFITGYQRNTMPATEFWKRGLPCSDTFVSVAIKVPCGKCPECRAKRKREWIMRTIAEMETSDYAYFVTLTYDNDHLIQCNKEDVQKFLNRFRKHNKCRYLFVAELGSESNRPHYHAILFPEKPLTDLERINNSKTLLYYRSNFVERCWDNKGFVQIAEANAATIAYTVGYMVQKEKKTVFKLQSQGLGYEYFKDLKKSYVLSDSRGHEMITSLPRYLKAKYNLDFDVNYYLLGQSWRNEVKLSDMSEEQYRCFKEYLQEAAKL